jgi:alpha-mannosidase
MRPSFWFLHFSGFIFLVTISKSAAQMAWFVDGYHGGIYGHYPASFTQFIVDELKQHPEWKVNLEIEPETFDFIQTNTPDAYKEFKSFVLSPGGRIEFVNPDYAQSYLWNISGESVIQQFDRGMTKLREHFPNAEFRTYSSEEPCFTSALPGILRSFGISNAVLKNPNTCWAGYTRAFGGELVNWIGPDGTAIRTVPRYAIESFKPGSTWETIAAANAPCYIGAAFQAGIKHPIGMCLQDAGWRYGPWLKAGREVYQPTEYTTWRNYFENISIKQPERDWQLSQEDIQVSLVWGAQVLQRIAQQVRAGENCIVTAEKMATISSVFENSPWPREKLNEAWRTLLLSQHHDCWVVPYNGRRNVTWADKVAKWTANSRAASEAIIERSAATMTHDRNTNYVNAIRVFNTVATERSELVSVSLPEIQNVSQSRILDETGKEVPSQLVAGGNEILFRADAPSLGYSTYRLQFTPATNTVGATANRKSNGIVRVETDFYRIELNPVIGGAIESLTMKKSSNRELVDSKAERHFNELRGYFGDRNQFCSTADNPATIEILEKGPVRVKLKIMGQIASYPVTQWITLVQGEPRIDFRTRIGWRGNPRIGADFTASGAFRRDQNRKAFYDDRFKLLALFPVNVRNGRIFKDAPFDVTASHLTNTFFDSWTGIKNNVILRWADLYDERSDIGLALFTDNTTSYSFGSNQPLSLTLQYAGVGLWGRDYTVRGPTDVSYSLLPHRGNQAQANVWLASDCWNEPMIGALGNVGSNSVNSEKSFLRIDGAGWEVPTMRRSENRILIRLFNASSDIRARTLHFGTVISKAELVRLDGSPIKELLLQKDGEDSVKFDLALPRYGIATLRLTP